MKSRILGFALICAANATHGNPIEEVITTASPIHTDADKIIQGISVLSGQRLRENAAATLGETLQGELGISNSSFGPGVGIPVIRGQSSARVKVMQGSLDTLDASDTSPDHAISAEPLLAQRIEVLRGPATLRYGNGAIGGVVNIIDERIPTSLNSALSGGAEVRYDSVNDAVNNIFKLQSSIGQFAWYIDGVYREANDTNINGYAQNGSNEGREDVIENTDLRSKATSAGISWINEESFIGFSVSRLENNYGIPGGGHLHEEEHDDEDHGDEDHNEEEHEEEEEIIRIDLRQTRYDLKAGMQDVNAMIEKVDFRIAYNDYQHVELEGSETGTRFRNKAWEGRLEVIHQPWQQWQGAVGLQVTRRDFSAVGEEAFVPPADIENHSLFLVEDLDIDLWHLELGIRGEQQRIKTRSGNEKHNTVSLSAGAQWHLHDDYQVSFSFSRAQRAPSVEELFSFGAHLATQQFILGDQNLDEETSQNFELGFHYHNDLEFRLFVFYNAIDDFIYEQNQGIEDEESGLAIFNYLQQDASFSGIEAELNWPINEQWQLSVFGDTVRAKFDDGGDVPRITPNRFGAQLHFEQQNLSAKLRVSRNQRQNHAGDFEEKTDAYTRLDAKFSYFLNYNSVDYTFFLNLNNILDDEIRNATSYLRDVAPEPGRNASMGLRVTF